MPTIRIRVIGSSPLVQNNNTLCDPLHPLTKQKAALTGKRKKTDADHEQIGQIEFVAGLYMNENGPIIPAGMFRACLIEGAKRDKMGSTFKTGLFVESDGVLEYEGPRDSKSLYADKSFVWRCPVGNQRSTIIRTRARFNDWASEFDVYYDNSMIDLEHIENAIRHSEKIGMGDARALGYGKFKAHIVEPAAVA